MKRNVICLCAAIGLLSGCNTTTSTGELNYAIMNENLVAVRAGIENGANVNGTNNKLDSRPIHTAAGKGNIAILRELVAAGAEVDVPDCAGRTPLMYAVKANSLAVSRYLVEKGAEVNRTAKDSNRTCNVGSPEDTPLVIASATNNTETVRFLMNKGATAGGQRAFAFSLLDESREPVAKQFRAAGYKVDEQTVRMVADISADLKSGGASQQAANQTQTAQSKQPDDDSYGLADAALDAAATGAVLALIGF
ncbi:ankyrin repeat domain-containing protein [Hoeflea sp. CAU 1731]